MGENRQDVTATIKRIEVLLARAGRIDGGQSLALDNFTGIEALNGSASQPTPHSQTGASSTNVAIITAWPRFSGLFFVSVRASWSDNTTAGSVTHSLLTKQGASNGALGGTTTLFAKIGAFFGQNTLPAATQGGTLATDATGGAGMTFETSGSFTITQHSDVAATLTGLLSTNGLGTQNFESGWMLVDAAGSTSLTKTPFTLGKPAAFCLQLTSTAAHVISYDAISFFAQEQPFP